MTKTLTEQWYDDTIDRSHHYYVRIKGKRRMGCDGIDFIDIIRPPLFRDMFDSFMEYNDPEVLAPVPDYQTWKDFQQHFVDKLELEVKLKKAYEQLEQQSIKVVELQEQLKEAREVVKFYAETTVGHKRKDGTYGMWICSGEVAWENPLDRIESRMDYICYDPRPAKKWLKKWGVK